MTKNCTNCGNSFETPTSIAHRRKYCSYACYWSTLKGKSTSPQTQFKQGGHYNKGAVRTHEHREKIRTALLGRKLSIETRKKMSDERKQRIVDGRCNLWKGGKTKEGTIIRSSLTYRLWREQIFKRDNYTCQECGVRNGSGRSITLNADHIRPFALFPELRFEMSNGRTLCVDCHKKTDTYMGRIKNYTYAN